MTEKEIIQYLKDNKKNGIIYAFMPEDVKNWIQQKCFNVELLIWCNSDWEVLHGDETFDEDRLIALPENFRIETEIEYEDFDINEDGYFTIDGFHYLWCCWQDFLMEYSPRYINFGGWQYDGCDDWFMNPHIFYNDRLLEHYKKMEIDGKKVKPIIPIKIRFFKRK